MRKSIHTIDGKELVRISEHANINKGDSFRYENGDGTAMVGTINSMSHIYDANSCSFSTKYFLGQMLKGEVT